MHLELNLRVSRPRGIGFDVSAGWFVVHLQCVNSCSSGCVEDYEGDVRVQLEGSLVMSSLR